MGTNYIAPTWRQPENTNKSKNSNYSIRMSTYERVSFESAATQFNGSFSISFFGYYTDMAANTEQFGPAKYAGGSNNKAYYFSLYGPGTDEGKMNFRCFAPGDVQMAAGLMTSILSKNQWHHFCAVFTSGSKVELWLNGESAGSVSTSETSMALASSINNTIGAIDAGNYPMRNGNLADVSYYDVALNQSQIQYLRDQNNPMVPGTVNLPKPTTYLPLGDNSNPTATAGYPNISVGADSVFDFTADSKITLPSSVRPTNVMTVSQWLKAPASGHGFSYSIATLGANTGWAGFSMYHASATSLQFQIQTSSTPYVTTAVNINDNTWHHVVGVYNGSDIRIYLDGLEKGSPTSVSGDISYRESHSNLSVTIGNYPTSNLDFNGLISNTQIWDTNLSAPEVATLYNYGSPLSGTQPQAANLKGWWKLNQTANWEADTAGEWQIPDNRSSFPTSFNISGSTQMTVMNQNLKGTLNQIAGSFSASIWFKTSSTSSLTIMARTRGGGPTRDLGWSFAKDYFYNNGAYLLFSAYNTNGDNILVRNTTSPYLDPQGNPLIVTNDNKWHHGLCVYDKDTSNVKIYVDGILQNSVTQSGFGDYPLPVYGNIDANAGGSRTTIGGINNGSAMSSLAGSFNGELSNAQVWNKSLSSSNAISLYNTGIPLTTNAVESSNLICWNKLDIDDTFTTNAENKGNFAIFNQTASTGVSSSYLNFVNDGVSSRNPGVYGGFNYFGFRTANYSSPTTYHQLTSDHLSFSCWFKFNGPYTSGNKERTLVSFSDSYYQTITYYDNGAFRIYGNNASRFVGSDHTPFTNGEWHNLIIYIPNATSNNEGGMKLFLDGEEVFLSTSYSGFQYDRKQSVIGSFNYSGGGLPPRAVAYADWVIYDTDVTSSVSTIYNNGVPNDVSSLNPFLYYKFDSSNCNFITDGNNSRMEFTDVSGNNRGAFGPWNNLSGNNSPRLKTENIRGGSVSLQGNTNITLTEQNLVNNNVSTLNGESSGMDTTNLVTSNLTKKQPFSSYSINFDGTSEYIPLASSSTAIVDWTQPYSISLWVKYSTPLSWDLIATFGIETGSTSTTRYIMIGGNSGYLFTGVGDTNGGATTVKFNIGSGLDQGDWHHLVYVGDGTSGDFPTVYIDGVVAAPSGGTTSLFNSSTYLNVIGTGSTATGRYFPGKMSNVSIFNTALSQDDILNLYNNGVPQDLNNFRIKPKAWWPLDQSYTYFNGSVLVARDVINSNDGTGVNIIQENIKGNAPGSTGNGTGTNLNIANLKGNMYNSNNNSYSINMADYADSVTNPANSGRSTSVPG